jgi:Alkylmercury lyase
VPTTDLDLESLRLAIYASLANTGAAPSHQALAEALRAPIADVRDGLRALGAARHLALDTDANVLMAHPFATIPLGFSVMGRGTLWWGGCAWDSFALPSVLPADPEVLVATTCPACGTAHTWVVGLEAPPAGEQVAHFLVPMQHVWDDVVHACSNQRLFCSDECVDQWLISTGHARGYVMDLPTLWHLARHWYDGRMERGYTRRDPQTAAAYFHSVGLHGPFWGN